MKISLKVSYAKLPADVKSAEELSRFLITESILGVRNNGRRINGTDNRTNTETAVRKSDY